MQPNPQETAELVTFTEEILNGKLHFVCSVLQSCLSQIFVGDPATLQKQPPKVFCEKNILRNFTNFVEKHLCQSLFFDKAAGHCDMSRDLNDEIFF